MLALVFVSLPVQAAASIDDGSRHKPPTSHQSVRPNIVMVMADDMRVDDLLFAPRVRRLIGGSGLRFTNSFSPYPLCCPARASFLTGQYAHNHGVHWHEAPYAYRSFDDSRTLATSLRSAGYRTGFIGKYLNRYGLDRSRVSGKPSHRHVPAGWDDWRGALEVPRRLGIGGSTYNYFNTPYNVNGRIDASHRGEYQTDVVGTMSRRMAARFAKKQAPFFMYVNYVAPHFGGTRERDDPPRTIRDANGRRGTFRTPARPTWVKGRFDHVIDRPAGMPRDGGPSEADVSDKPPFQRRLPEMNAAEYAAVKKITRQRAEAIYVMDRQIGRLVRALKRAGEWNNTVFMFTSDNGYYLGEHRTRVGKVRSQEPSLRVPFLVTGPGMRDAEVRHDPITTVDVSATILDLANAAAPRPADGHSVLPTMLSGDVGWTIPVVTEAARPDRGSHRDFTDRRTQIGLRTQRYSYTRYDDGFIELYDLAVDPLQRENKASAAGYADVMDRMLTLWWRYKDCDAAACQVPLPDALAASPTEAASATRAYWSAVDAVYGWR